MSHLPCAILLLSRLALASPINVGAAASPAGVNDPIPLPTAEALIRELKCNQAQVQKRIEQYIWRETSTLRTRNGKGELVKEEASAFEATWVKGHLIHRLVEKNGEPLAADLQAKEDSRIKDQISSILQSREKADSADQVEGRITPLDILECVHVTSVARESVRGLPTLVIRFEPNGHIKPANTLQEQASKLKGVIHVDEAAMQIMDMDAQFAEPLRIGAGLIASFAAGSSFSFEQAPVKGGVWLPLSFTAHFKGRIAIFKKVDLDAKEDFSDYKQAVVDVPEGQR